VLIFVNSFSFIFLEFLAKIYWPNFFSQAKNAKKGRYTGDGTGPPPGTGWAGRPGLTQGGPSSGSPRFFPGMLLFDFLCWSTNFKGSLNKENAVSRVFLFGLFIWPNWELGNPSHLAFFCTHVAAMVSPKSVELKQGAKEPSMENAKRCELKLPVEIKRTARIRCRRACSDRSGRISQPCHRGERPYSRSKVGAHLRHEAEGLQGGVARA
jgi:hypothetical protein